MHTKYRHLTDIEFLNIATVDIDPMVSTELEQELLHRFTQAAVKEAEQLNTLLEDFELTDIKKLEAVLKAVNEFVGDMSESTLREKLERADSFYDLAQEAGDIFARLNELAKKTQ